MKKRILYIILFLLVFSDSLKAGSIDWLGASSLFVYNAAQQSPIAMDNNLKFAIREGGRTVGAGVVTKIIE